jgi:PPOX class probable F420-dependent enzyme
MAVELTQEVPSRLESDHHGWLNTVAKSGQPVPRMVWFYYDGAGLVVSSQPHGAKVRHVQNNPRVSLNLGSDGNGGGIIVVGGNATVDAADVDRHDDNSYWDKYGPLAEQFGLSEAMSSYSTRLKISIDKVWTTPGEG